MTLEEMEETLTRLQAMKGVLGTLVVTSLQGGRLHAGLGAPRHQVTDGDLPPSGAAAPARRRCTTG